VRLDFNPKKQIFFLMVERGSADIQELIREHGLDLSLPASTERQAVLMTREPYAAASFFDHGTERAKAQLAAIQNEIALSWSDDSAAHIKCPMDKELWPFQRGSVSYALRRRNTLVADQPGLGKTPIAICYANEIAAKRVLVICPASIRLQWCNRIREWSTMDWPFNVHSVLKGRNGINPYAPWTVVSYDLARTEAIGRALAENTYDLLVLDEAHYLKDYDAQRTRAIFGDHTGQYRRRTRGGPEQLLFEGLAHRSGSVLALTGTPLPNRPREAYTLARGLCFDSIDWLSEDHFRERFNPSARITRTRADGSEYTFTREEVGRVGELQNRLRANFMVRHLKRDVMPQLKLPVYDVVRVEETKPVKMALEAESLLDIDIDALESGDFEVLGNWSIARHNIGLAIAPQVCDYAKMCLEGGDEKLLVGAWHIDVLDIYCRALQEYGVLRIDGSTSATQKQAKVERFCSDPAARVLVGNVLSLGTGTDGLQSVCSHLLLGEPDPVPGNNEQFVDRLDRGGQIRTVLADLFVAPGSLLERILVRALEKRQNTHKALDQTYGEKT